MATRYLELTAVLAAASVIAACGGKARQSGTGPSFENRGGTAGQAATSSVGGQVTAATGGDAAHASIDSSYGGSGAVMLGTGGGGRAGAGAGSADAPACTWPAQFDAVEPSADSCTAKRAVVECQYGGETEECMSDSLDACPDTSAHPGAACSDLCDAGEYGLACGAPYMNPLALDAGCRALPPNPGGLVFWYCCPCGGHLDTTGAAGSGATDGSAGASGAPSGTEGGAGQADKPSCESLAAAYADAVTEAVRCDPTSEVDQCVVEVGSSVPCLCPTPATTTDRTDAAYRAFTDAGCEPPETVCNCPAQFNPPFACSAEGVCDYQHGPKPSPR